MSDDNDNVIVLPVVTKLDIPADRILDGALEDKLDKVVVLGYDMEGEEYFASSIADGGEVIWLIERAKLKLLNTV